MSWWKKLFGIKETQVNTPNNSSDSDQEISVIQFKNYQVRVTRNIHTKEVCGFDYSYPADMVEDLLKGGAKLSNRAELLSFKLNSSNFEFLRKVDGQSLNEDELFVIINLMFQQDLRNVDPSFVSRIFIGDNEVLPMVVLDLMLKNSKKVLAAKFAKRNLDSVLVKDLQVEADNVYSLILMMTQLLPLYSKNVFALKLFDSNMRDYLEFWEAGLNVLESESLRFESFRKMKSVVFEKLDHMVNVTLNNLETCVGNFFIDKNELRVLLAGFGIKNLPAKEFKEETNELLLSIEKKYSMVNREYLENDLSREVPKMFSDVLAPILKNFFALPEGLRGTMFNADGKTMEEMLLSVLKLIDNRLDVLSKKSHSELMHEVHVLESFSQDRWNAESR